MAGRQFLRHWWWALLCGGVALAGIASALILGTGGSPGPSSLRNLDSAHSGTARPSGPVAASPAGSSPRAGSAPTRGRTASHAPRRPAPAHQRPPAAAPLPPRVSASLRSWAAGPGGAALARVSGPLGTCAQAGGLQLYHVMEQACTQLSAAVAAAGAGPPIPDAAMQHRFARALATLAGAASHCRAAISVHSGGGEQATTTVNRALLRHARAELAAGASELYLATSQIKLPSRR
jgi:hypothetical protein